MIANTSDQDVDARVRTPFATNRARWLGGARLAVALLGLAGAACCRQPESPKPPEEPDNPTQRTAVEQQLTNAAEKTKAWSDADERDFRRNLIGLTTATRFELSKRLATLINTNTIKVARPTSYKVDPPVCPVPCRAADDPKPAPASPGTGGTPAPTRGK